ncbi:MAG: 50S ribosomal protein L29 [Saprospiraceae bacterium]|nr:50S ribosomal protein L29 [Saprospiraceae bacterium]MDW8229469.1 50S ribosomal protein L29 [Saprospiraceae bacterium]
MAKEKLDLRNLEIGELHDRVRSLQDEYLRLKFEHAARGLANPLELRNLRRDIARYHTEARRRELEAMSPDELAMRTKLVARRRRQRRR